MSAAVNLEYNTNKEYNTKNTKNTHTHTYCLTKALAVLHFISL